MNCECTGFKLGLLNIINVYAFMLINYLTLKMIQLYTITHN